MKNLSEVLPRFEWLVLFALYSEHRPNASFDEFSRAYGERENFFYEVLDATEKAFDIWIVARIARHEGKKSTRYVEHHEQQKLLEKYPGIKFMRTSRISATGRDFIRLIRVFLSLGGASLDNVHTFGALESELKHTGRMFKPAKFDPYALHTDADSYPSQGDDDEWEASLKAPGLFDPPPVGLRALNVRYPKNDFFVLQKRDMQRGTKRVGYAVAEPYFDYSMPLDEYEKIMSGEYDEETDIANENDPDKETAAL